MRHAPTLAVALFAFCSTLSPFTASAGAREAPAKAGLAQVAQATPRAESSCGMSVAAVYHLMDGGYAVTLHGIDEDGGVVRVAFKGPHVLAETAGVPVVTPRRAGGAFTSDPIVLGPPPADAYTIALKALAPGTEDLTCTIAAMPLAAVTTPPAGVLPTKLPPRVPLLLAYDLSACAADPDRVHDVPAHVIAESPFPPAYLMQPGTADVAVRLDDDGDIERGTVVRADNPSLNKVALDAAVLATVAPNTQRCRPVGGTFTFVFDFSLKSI